MRAKHETTTFDKESEPEEANITFFGDVPQTPMQLPQGSSHPDPININLATMSPEPFRKLTIRSKSTMSSFIPR